MATVGERIRAQREAMSLSQTKLAELVGVSKQTLYKYENNIVCNIPRDKLLRLAKALDTTPSWLIGWEEVVVTSGQLLESEAVRQVKAEVAQMERERQHWSDQLADLFPFLNELGRQEAIQRVEELTLNPRFRRQDDE